MLDVYRHGNPVEEDDWQNGPQHIGAPGTRIHVIERYPNALRTTSHKTIDDALDHIGQESVIPWFSFFITQCTDLDCELCMQAYADEQG